MLLIYNFPGLIGAICSLCFSGVLISIFPHLPEPVKNIAFTLPLALTGFGLEMFGVRAHLYYIRLYIIGSIATLVVVYQGYGEAGLVITCATITIAYLLSRVFNEEKRWHKAQKALDSYLALMPGNGDMREHHLLEALFMNRWLLGTQARIEHNRTVVGHFLNDPELTLSQPEIQVLQTAQKQMERGPALTMGWRMNYVDNLQKRLEDLRQSRGIGRFAMG